MIIRNLFSLFMFGPVSPDRIDIKNSLCLIIFFFLILKLNNIL